MTLEKHYEIQLNTGDILEQQTVESIRKMVQRGELSSTDKIRRTGGNTWHLLESVRGIEFSKETQAEIIKEETESNETEEIDDVKEAVEVVEVPEVNSIPGKQSNSEYIHETKVQEKTEEDHKSIDYQSLQDEHRTTGDDEYDLYAVTEKLQKLLDMTFEDIEQGGGEF